MGVTLASWLAALQQLLPPGRALTRAPGATLTKLLEAIAAMFLFVQLRFELLLEEWEPRTATTLLTDWERVLGLPDDCAPTATLSIVERQRVAYQRLIEEGGQSRAYFLGIAAQLGEPNCTITEFRAFNCDGNCNSPLYSVADNFVWRVNIPHAAANARLITCNDSCQDALQLYAPNLIECPIRERRPAHTTVLFSYTS